MCVLGAECTGKTTLAQALAQHLGGLYVPEALRDWCARKGRTPQRHEQARLVALQLRQQRRAMALARRRGLPWVVLDTSALMTAVYSLHYFQDARLLARALRVQRRFDLTLVLPPDLPWVADPGQRDGPAARAAVHRQLLALASTHPHWLLLDAAGQRLAQACAAIQARTNG
ncbi:MAG: hypothetical protein OHK0048_16140 [Rhodoferax sp.]